MDVIETASFLFISLLWIGSKRVIMKLPSMLTSRSANVR